MCIYQKVRLGLALGLVLKMIYHDSTTLLKNNVDFRNTLLFDIVIVILNCNQQFLLVLSRLHNLHGTCVKHMVLLST